MKFSHLFKTAVVLFAATGLAGCFDVDMEVAITGPDTALVTTSTTLSKDMVSLADLKSGDSEFCNDSAEIIENETSITCVETLKGSFAEIMGAGDKDQPQPTIELVAPNRVKINFPTRMIADEFNNSGDGEDTDPQVKAMIKQMFEGHAITIRVSGPKVVETNMTLSDDAKSAEINIAFSDLFEKTMDLPENSYALIELD